MKSLILVLGVAVLCSVSVLLGCAQPNVVEESERPLTRQESIQMLSTLSKRTRELEEQTHTIEKILIALDKQRDTERLAREAAAEKIDKRFDVLEKGVLKMSEQMLESNQNALFAAQRIINLEKIIGNERQ